METRTTNTIDYSRELLDIPLNVKFSIKNWAAIAPGLQSKEAWMRWADVAYCPVGTVAVELPQVPPMVRRRLGHLARIAITAVDSALSSAQSIEMPIIWASRYGDAEKSTALLMSQASDESLSPTTFGLSVHNGVSAQHSILRGIHANAICIASSGCVPESGLVEAMGLLSDGAPEVLLVCYDTLLPTEYAMFHDEPVTEFVWAVLLVPLLLGEQGFSLQSMKETLTSEYEDSDVTTLPHGLDVLHFFLQTQRQRLVHTHRSGKWMWERLDG